MRQLGDILELKDDDCALASRAIAGLAFDSRKTAPGDVFFALAGAKDDGLKHVGEAVAKGATAIVAERSAETPNAAFVKVADARAALAHAAARFYRRQPATIVAVTGTSGKTSVVAFVRQIWQALEREAASIGTIGVVSHRLTVYGSLTTPDPIALHEFLSQLAAKGVTSLAIEASSHGLNQKRLDGVRLAPASRSPNSTPRRRSFAIIRRSRSIWRPSSSSSKIFCLTARRRSSTPTAPSLRA